MTNPQPEEKELPAYYQSPSYISHSNKSSNLLDKIYKLTRTYTLKWKYDLIRKHSSGTPGTLLDFGCGTGAFLAECTKHRLTIAGVEPSPVARAEAARQTRSDIKSSLAEIDGTFDVITLWHVLEHITDLHGTIDQLKKTLAKNGTMFIAVPNLNSSDANKYKEHWAAYDVPRHLWHFTRETMQMILSNHQLKLQSIKPMRLDAYYVSILSEKYRAGGNSLMTMTKALLSGWQSNHRALETQEYSSLIYIARK